MAVSFSRTVRSLHSVNPRSLFAGTVVVAIFFGLWCWWFVASEVAVYEASEDAWIEAVDAAHWTAAPVSGRVVQVELEIGRWVEKGDPLVVLSSIQVEQQYSQEIERREGAEKGLVSLGAIRKMTNEGAKEAHTGDLNRIDRARADLRSAEAGAELASAEMDRALQLHAQGLVSNADLERARAAVAQSNAIVISRKAGLAHLESEIRFDDSERWRAVAEIDNRIAALEAEEGVAEFGSAEFASELEERTIRAPISGWLGRVSPCKPGSVVMVGDLIAVVIPDGGIKISARFQAAPGLGRIESGQPARMRLHALPWTRYDEVEADVVRVGQDASDGFLRVECRLRSGQEIRERLQHGMQGTLVVEVDRLSPLEMAFTVAGRPWGKAAGSDVPVPGRDERN